ncbi:unnamed protein product [Brassica napus]|uniref:(rape) hypothetical protein n=1 Tax=Brassica napus TaxID=3708 RepID=A0A816JGW6_BRANA|nr:unnamed protein product [Brassica napus]
MGTQTTVLAVTDDVVLPVISVLTVMKVVGKEGVERCDPMIITQASTISQVPLDSSSVDAVLAVSTTSEFPTDKIYGEFSRILKPGGTVFVCTNSEGENVELQQTLQSRVTLAGFIEPQSLDLTSIRMPNWLFILSVGVSSFIHVFSFTPSFTFISLKKLNASSNIPLLHIPLVIVPYKLGNSLCPASTQLFNNNYKCVVKYVLQNSAGGGTFLTGSNVTPSDERE